MSAYISGVEQGSLAERHGIKPGSTLLKINGNDITDVLDYRFYMVDDVLRVLWKSPEDKFTLTKIVKRDEYDDIGLTFDTYLMDKQRSCRNKCIFCFIDQLPKGMRESLYFKDDDSRMSFFYGNYITLTNLTQADVDRIISMHISPVNVSVHTMNPELRVKMMNNKNAGKSLDYLRQLSNAGISINTQLVLCPGINDGEELEFSLRELSALAPAVQSIACVPVGLTDHRAGLFELKMYEKDTARCTIDIIDRYAEEFKQTLGKRLCYAADEFYLQAELPFPEEDYYEGYPQLDNGVGLCRLLESEVHDKLAEIRENGEMPDVSDKANGKPAQISIATGFAALSLIEKLAGKVEELYSGALKVHIYGVENRFFGRNITVSGLITGQDLAEQLQGKELGQALLISNSMLRTTYPQDNSNDNVFLDDMTTEQLSEILGVPVYPVANDGYEFVEKIMEVGTCQGL